MVNMDSNGIRYGVIATRSLDPDLEQELFFGPQAIDRNYESAYAEAKANAERDWDNFQGDAETAASEVDSNMSDSEREKFIERWFIDRVYGCDDKEEYVDMQLEMFSDTYQGDEPNISGEMDGVTYEISWLGGAPILFVISGPEGMARQLCSPCVPGSANLDDGYVLDSEMEGGPEWIEIGISEFDHDNGYPCYCVPRDWLRID